MVNSPKRGYGVKKFSSHLLNLVGVAVDDIRRVGEQRRSTKKAYEISLVDGFDVSGRSSWRYALGTPKLDIVDDEAVIRQTVSGCNGCLRCENHVQDVASVVRNFEVGLVLHMLEQFQLFESIGHSVVKCTAEPARQIMMTANV